MTFFWNISETSNKKLSPSGGGLENYGSAPGIVKVLVKIAEKNPNLKIHAGVLVDSSKTSVLDDAQVEALSKLPAKEELLVKLLFLLQAPATQLVRTLNEVPAKFVRTLAAVRDSKE